MRTLGNRLETALKHVEDANLLVDIGTDHAYLPIKAVLLGKARKAIAVDNKPGPLSRAKHNIETNDLGSRIKTVLSDGFAGIDLVPDIVTILGLGGIQIRDILETCKTKIKKLVLSPNSEAYTLRDWLENNGYMIIAEDFIIDGRKHYQVIVASPGEMSLDEPEKEFGPLILATRPKAFTDYLRNVIAKLVSASRMAHDETEKSRIMERIRVLKGLIE